MYPVYYYEPKPPVRIGPFTFSRRELHDIFWSWLVISLAFTIVMSPSGLTPALFGVFIFSALTVGIGFLSHELAHRTMARRYGCHAEFVGFPNMWWIALLSSLIGFIFAAPGAVMISGYVDRRRNGIISLAGPVTNLLIAIIFLALAPHLGDTILRDFALFGYRINGWLALFNLIPFGGLDGSKVLAWNKGVYAAAFMAAFVFAFIL
ncbi:MAG: site-2 protease family protein [Candidatus Altiarchaeota archaeon]